jgi:D-3-phosphoglycerate dehydrogenase / 2-oxoglutarate reductase
MTYHVLIPDNVDRLAVELLERAEGITVTAPGNMTREQTLAAIPNADALIIRSSTKVDAEMIATAPRLKVIARAGVGVDNVDLDAATARGIAVMNTPDGNTVSTAEYTLGLMLALARHIPRSYVYLQEGRWDRKAFTGVELRGKTLGIVGFGRVGQAVAKRALAFEMIIIAYDPYVPAETAESFGAEMVDLDTLYTRSDFITLHSLITDETREMIRAESIARMKPGVRIVNSARGALINDEDLAAAIRSGQVAGAALDVYQQEPPPADHPLIGLQNVIHTPHLAASTSDAQVQVGVDAAQEIIDALLKGDFRNVVNPAALQKQT